MIGEFKKGERLGAGKLNELRSSVLGNNLFNPGLKSPDGMLIRKSRQRVMDTSEDESILIFGMDYSPTDCTVYEGKWYYDGAWRTFAEASIDLSGSESFVYVAINRTSLAMALKQSSVEPTPTADEAILVIAHFIASGSCYTLNKRWYKGGAYYAEAPLPS